MTKSDIPYINYIKDIPELKNKLQKIKKDLEKI